MNSNLIKIVLFTLMILITQNSLAATSDDLFKKAFSIYKDRTPEAKERSFPLLKEAALKGHVKAAGLVGSMLLHGDGVKKNAKEAVHWLHQASDGDETVAMMNLAMAYGRGEGVKEPNRYMVLSLLQRAEELGDNQASNFIKQNRLSMVLPVFQSNYFIGSKVNNLFNEKIIHIEGVIKDIEYNAKGQPIVELSIPRRNINSFWVASQTNFNKDDFKIGHTIRVAGHLAPDTEKDPATTKGRYMLGLCLFSMDSQFGSFFKFAENTCSEWMKGV